MERNGIYRIVVSLFVATFFLSVNAQTEKKVLSREGDKLYISYDEGKSRSLVNENIVTVKLKSNKTTNRDFNILRSNRLGYMDLSVPEGVDVIEYVGMLERSDMFEMVKSADAGEICLSPNDTYISNQWYLATINMPGTWNITTGNADIKVAVLDREVDWNHKDIGIGLDGYKNIDSSLGYNYMEGTSQPVTPHTHGTFVAGIIGAKTNNHEGIAGVTGGNGCAGITIIPYCVGSTTGINNIDMATVDDAILDAVDKGAKVINMSFRSTISIHPDIDDAIDYAYNHGVIMVAASGNDHSSSLGYPASHPKVIAVGATDQNNHRASFSNYGTGLDLVAPGVDIFSTTLNNGYDSQSGTSFAAPQVSGVAALMLSVNPTLSPDSIRSILRATCTKPSGYTYTSGWNNQVGYGLLNAYAAIKRAALSSLSFIKGKEFVCDSTMFTLSGLPTGATATWSLNVTYGNGSGSVTTLGDGTNCMVYNLYPNEMFEGWLTANIYLSGELVATKRKMIRGDSFFTGFYWDGAPYEDVRENFMMEDDNWITQNSVMLIRSDNLRGKNIEIYRNSEYNSVGGGSSNGSSEFFYEVLGFNPGDTLKIRISGDGCCNEEEFLFFVQAVSRSQNNHRTLQIQPLGEDVYKLVVPTDVMDKNPSNLNNAYRNRSGE